MEVFDMSLKYAFLLTFIAGGISVWLCVIMSGKVQRKRMEVINNYIGSLEGNVLRIDLIDRKHCPFSDEYHNPDLVYKFYKISYAVKQELKEGWAVLEMKQPWYGPGGAIEEQWIWRL